MITITTVAVPDFTQNQFQVFFFEANTDEPPVQWNVIGGTLPPGLNLNLSTGALQGLPTTPGSYTFTVQVLDAFFDSDTAAFTVIVHPSGPQITTTSLPNGQLSIAYSETLQSTGGVPPLGWTIESGSLPTGLTLNTTTGEISGTPSATGDYTFSVRVTDDNLVFDDQSLSISIPQNNPTIITTSLPDGTSNVPYSQTVVATGGTLPYTTWEVSVGALPPGIFISHSGGSATLSGTPTTPGTYAFTLEVEDSNLGLDTQAFSVTIAPPGSPVILTPSFPNGLTSSAYSQTLTAAGGTAPYTWSVSLGTIPTGLTLAPTTGVLAGTPTNAGVYNFTVEVVDFNNLSSSKSYSITILSSINPSIITDGLYNGRVGDPYEDFAQVEGGCAPYTWAISAGTLPAGLTLDTTTGRIYGTPTTTGLSTFTVQVTDCGTNVATKSLSIFRVNTGELYVKPSILPAGYQTVYYSVSITTIGGTLPYTYTLDSGPLPAGLTLSPSGVISGTPTETGVFSIDILVEDTTSGTPLTYLQTFDLEINKISLAVPCCYCAIGGTLVKFNHNAYSGILTATGGTIVDSFTWIAPETEGLYLLQLTIDTAYGPLVENTIIRVIEPIVFTNVTDGVIDTLLPGESFQIETNYPVEDLTWETVDYEIPIVNRGNITIHTNPADRCFGALECTIRATYTNPGGACSDLGADLKVIVNPTYPTPDVCGPEFTKWRRQASDYRVIVTEFEGGCDETHIRNRAPIIRWDITYQGLQHTTEPVPICPGCLRCFAHSGSCSTYTCPNIVVTGAGECLAYLKTANRIDDFWDLVYGQYKKFNLYDQDTGQLWRNVKFEGAIDRDHIHRRTSAARTITMVLRPCCNNTPVGGQCSTHGMVYFTKAPLESPVLCCEPEL